MKAKNSALSHWGIVTSLLLATTINYIDRQTLSVLAPVLQRQLHISSLQYSYAVNAFLVVYAVMYLVMGAVIDRLGTRNGLGMAVLWWSIIEILHVTVIGIETLCVYRALLAIGEAAIVPGGVKAVAEWFDAKQRSVAVGAFEMGFSLGPLIAPPLVGWISLRQGWHAAFLWTGLLGMIWVIPWFLFYHRPTDAAPEQDPSLRSRNKRSVMPWKALFHSREAWAIGFARFFSDPVWFFYLFWIPKYLSDSHGLSLKSIAAVAWIPYVGSLAGSLSGGTSSSWLVRRGVPVVKAREWLMLLSAVLVSAGVLCIYLTSLFWVVTVMSVATFGMQFWGANLDTLPIDLFSAGDVGQTMGFAGLMASAGGILFTAGTGYVVQNYSYTPVWIATAITYPIGLALLVALLCRSSHSARPGNKPRSATEVRS
jgi:MFS transporter, ACS family, hexuronate transporter